MRINIPSLALSSPTLGNHTLHLTNQYSTLNTFRPTLDPQPRPSLLSNSTLVYFLDLSHSSSQNAYNTTYSVRALLIYECRYTTLLPTTHYILQHSFSTPSHATSRTPCVTSLEHQEVPRTPLCRRSRVHPTPPTRHVTSRRSSRNALPFNRRGS